MYLAIKSHEYAIIQPTRNTKHTATVIICDQTQTYGSIFKSQFYKKIQSSNLFKLDYIEFVPLAGFY